MAAAWALFCRDLWTPIWPNLAASVIWTLPVLAWHHVRMRRHFAEETHRLRAAIAELVLDHHRDRLEEQ